MEGLMDGLPNELFTALRDVADYGYDDAWAMPGAFYVSPEMLDLERREIFAREWLCVGRADEIPGPGDYFTTDILGEPIAVVRGHDGAVRALSNVCRHRAMPVLSGSGTARRLVCPYHSWTYDTAGQLIGAPLMQGREDFDKKGCRLPEFGCEVWQGFVFVHLDPEAAPLAPRLADLDKRIAGYHFEAMHTRHVTHEIWETNWKSFVENFMEGYHLSALHKETLHPVNPTRLCEHFPSGDAYFGYTVGFDPSMARERIGHPDLTDAEIDTCVMIAIPPNLVIGGASDYSSFICFEPASTDAIRAKLGLFFHGDAWTEEQVDRAIVLFHDTMEEDKSVLDHIGRGLRSSRYTPGPLAAAPYEGCVLDLHKYVARRLNGAVAAVR